jgi:PAS domain-containing protein
MIVSLGSPNARATQSRPHRTQSHPSRECGAVAHGHNLDFSWQQVASLHELSEAAEEFKPHVVLCTDGAPNHGLLDALQLLCSQTPVILVSSLQDKTSAKAVRSRSHALAPGLRIQQDPADLRQGFSAVLESSTAPAVISDAEGWITHANARACQLLGSRDRRLVTVLSSAPDQCPPMPHWLTLPTAASDGARPERCQYRLAYFDSWSLLPTLVHMDDLVGRLTGSKSDARAALAVIAMDREIGLSRAAAGGRNCREHADRESGCHDRVPESMEGTRRAHCAG